MGRFPFNNNWIMQSDNRENEFSGEAAPISLSDTVFGFLDEGSSPDSDGVYGESAYDFNEEGDEEVKKNGVNIQEDMRSFWETQHQLLEGTLSRTSSIESRIRRATKEALREAQVEGNVCSCGGAGSDTCRNCLMKFVLSRLQNHGFNCAICKSKWRSSPEIPSGEHSFLEVVESSSNSRKGGGVEVRIIIELNLRGEFEMARAGEEYRRLVKKLPEVYIGKIERLLTIIKILCCCAKKCMKEKKLHMGPWRKQRYMQAKWLRATERMTWIPAAEGYSDSSTRPFRRPRGSMLTLDLLETSPNLHCKAVEVV